MPNSPKSLPAMWTVNSLDSVASLPNVPSAPIPPICRPKPIAQ